MATAKGPIGCPRVSTGWPVGGCISCGSDLGATIAQPHEAFTALPSTQLASNCLTNGGISMKTDFIVILTAFHGKGSHAGVAHFMKHATCIWVLPQAIPDVLSLSAFSRLEKHIGYSEIIQIISFLDNMYWLCIGALEFVNDGEAPVITSYVCMVANHGI